MPNRLLLADEDPKTSRVLEVSLRGAGFEVTVKNGSVTLLGRVHDAPAREKAARLAKKVKGVTSVDNKLKLFSDN